MEIALIIGVVVLMAVAMLRGGDRERRHAARRAEYGQQLAGEVASLMPGGRIGAPANGSEFAADFTVVLCDTETGMTLEPSPPWLLACVDVTSFNMPMQVSSTRLTKREHLMSAELTREGLKLVKPLIYELQTYGVQNFCTQRNDKPQVLQITATDIATLAEQWPHIEQAWNALGTVAAAHLKSSR